METNRKFKIMYVYSQFAGNGGAERVITDKMNYFVEKGHKVTFVTYEQGNHPFGYPLDPRIQHIDTGTRFFRLLDYPYYKRWIKTRKMKLIFQQKLQSIVEKIQPDVIITTTDFLPTCDVITKLNTSAKLIAESQLYKEATLVIYKNTNSWFRRLYVKALASYHYQKVKNFDILVALTEGDANSWKSIAKAVTVIPSPVTNYPDFIPEKDEEVKRIIAAGRLVPQKGFDRLIDAFAMIEEDCPGWHIDIFGDGKDREDLLQQIIDRKLEKRIFIHPYTPNIYGEFMKSNFFVLSSRFEGFGLVLVEALSCGLPCISYNCKYGPEDIITDGEDGFLVKEGDISKLAEKIKWMCNHTEERKRMSEVARINSKRYIKENIINRWIELFELLTK